jgi:predicted nuclease of predicted toxin-antitoxin system
MSYSDIITIETGKRGDRKLINRLADVFPESSHVVFHGLSENTDTEIWEFAKAHDFCIVTQDADFAERSRLYGSPPKVAGLRCGNTSTGEVESLIRSGAEAIQELLPNTDLDCLETY